MMWYLQTGLEFSCEIPSDSQYMEPYPLILLFHLSRRPKAPGTQACWRLGRQSLRHHSHDIIFLECTAGHTLWGPNPRIASSSHQALAARWLWCWSVWPPPSHQPGQVEKGRSRRLAPPINVSSGEVRWALPCSCAPCWDPACRVLEALDLPRDPVASWVCFRTPFLIYLNTFFSLSYTS